MRPPLINTLRQNEASLPSVPLWTHREVDPIAACLNALNIELIIIPLRAVGDIQEDGGIADRLFEARHADIHCAARQVVARGCAPCPLIHLRRTIARINHQGRLWLPLIQRVVAIPQIFEPILTEIPQVLNRHSTRNIFILSHILCLCEFPKFEVLTYSNLPFVIQSVSVVSVSV